MTDYMLIAQFIMTKGNNICKYLNRLDFKGLWANLPNQFRKEAVIF